MKILHEKDKTTRLSFLFLWIESVPDVEAWMVGHELDKGHSQSIIASLEYELSNRKLFNFEMDLEAIPRLAIFLWKRFD